MPIVRPPCSTPPASPSYPSPPPPRSTRNTISGTPGFALVIVATSLGERTARAVDRRRCDRLALSPARSAGLAGDQPRRSAAVPDPRAARAPRRHCPPSRPACISSIDSTRVTGGSPACGPAGSMASGTVSRALRLRRAASAGPASCALARRRARRRDRPRECRPQPRPRARHRGSASTARCPGMPAMNVPANSSDGEQQVRRAARRRRSRCASRRSGD